MGKRTRICTATFSLAGLLLSAAAGPAWSVPGNTVLFSQIENALSSGDGAQAVMLSAAGLGQAGLSDADRSRLLLDRGLANQLVGDQNAALADLTEAINAHSLTAPEQARAFLERGLVLDGMNRLNDAIGDYTAALRLDPNSPAALNNRANALRRQNRFADAQRDYLASLAADNPAPEYPYYGLGQIAESQGKAEEARSFYARALAVNPGYTLAGQRLAALGGAPDAGVITLHPPDSGPGNRLVLHPLPSGGVRAAAAPRPPPPTIKPAGYSDRDGHPGLRPALDNPGGQQVQLGAWRAEAEAAEGWNHALKAAAGALSGFSPHIVAVDLPGRGRYYRLRVETPDGKSLCAALTVRGLDCIPAKD